MQLADCLKRHNESQRAFARRAGLSVASVSRLCAGLQDPDWPTIEKIDAATGGAVTENDWREARRERLAQSAAAAT